MLENKKIVLCVCGGIAVYKVVDLASKLKKTGAQVQVCMTKSAQEFVTPLTFQTISNNKVYTHLFESTEKNEIPHIILGQDPDLIVVAPATANMIGKVSNGIADDLISTTIIAAKSPILFVPAMNTAMYENPIVEENILKLKKRGYFFMNPDIGTMAMKGEGSGVGRLPEPESILNAIIQMFFPDSIQYSPNEIFPESVVNLPKANIPVDGLSAYLSQGPNHQIVFMHFSKEYILPEHAHEEQWGLVLEGKITLSINGIETTYKKGDRYFIPSDVKHFGKIFAGYADISYFNQKDRYEIHV